VSDEPSVLVVGRRYYEAMENVVDVVRTRHFPSRPFLRRRTSRCQCGRIDCPYLEALNALDVAGSRDEL
jgi:hypothetical protein